MGDRRRRLGSREAFTVPRAGAGRLPQSREAFSTHKPPSSAQNLSLPTTRYPTTPEKSGSTLPNDELAKIYSNCIQLATENKITQKNSWQLNLIDYMEDVLEISGENPNFLAASCTLDAGVQIYSCRVDSVHTDTFKVLGGLTRTEREIEEHQEVAEEETVDVPSTEQPTSSKQKKAKRLSTGSVCTLEENVEVLNARKVDLAFLVDPLFRKMSAAFDQGGVKGLLFNHLEVQHGGYLVFDSADAIGICKESEATTDPDIPIDELYGMLVQEGDVDNIENLDICPTFSQFTFGDVQPRLEIKQEEDSEESISGDDETVPPDFDFSVPSDASFAANSSMDKSTDLSGANVSWVEHGLISPSIKLEVANADHWQFAANGKTDKAETKKPRKKKEKKQFFIDFASPAPAESLFKLPRDKFADLILDPVWHNAPEHLTTLKEEYPYDIENLTTLFFKPLMKSVYDDSSDSSDDEPEASSTPEEDTFNTSVKLERELELQQEEEDHGVIFSYSESRVATEEIQKESSGEEIETGTGGVADDITDFGDFGDLGGVTTVDVEEMVQEPQRVFVEPIKHAKTTNKVNVKELKAAMWGELQTLFGSGDQGGEKEVEKKVEFGALLEKVNPKVAQKDIGDVSVAMCFICTLHLCNEKDLCLSQQDMDQLIISAKHVV